MSPIGVDEWVARADERHEHATGLGGLVADWRRRIGWWPRLAALTLVAIIIGQLGLNVNLQAVAFNSALYALLALGLNIAVGWAGLLDLGYVAFFGVGAYVYALFSSHALGNLLGQTGGVFLPTAATIPIALVVCGILGVLVGLVALRLDGDYLAIVTLFLGLAFVEVVNNVDQGTLGGNNGIYDLRPFQAFGHQILSDNGYYYATVVVLILLMAALHLLEESRTGRAWKALRDDPLAARVMGVPVKGLRVMAFSFGAVVAGFAGAIFAAEQGSVFPNNFQSTTLILIYACLVVGGIGGISGAVLGGVLVTVAQAMLSSPTDSAYLFYGLMLVALVVRIRPWQRLAAVLVGVVVFGLALRAVVGAVSPSAVGGSPGSHGWIGTLMGHYVIIPQSSSVSFGNVLYVTLIPALVLMVRLKGIRRLVAIVPTVYLAACCWEARLSVDPGITAQIMLGACLIVVMAARPNGILGKGQVPVI